MYISEQGLEIIGRKLGFQKKCLITTDTTIINTNHNHNKTTANYLRCATEDKRFAPGVLISVAATF